jgi:hypothetical protein
MSDEHRANDPRQLAFKAAMNERRLEANQQEKVRRKAAMKEQKARRMERNRLAQDQQLMMMVNPATGPE